jgi:hypothetical protein
MIEFTGANVVKRCVPDGAKHGLGACSKEL